MAMTDFTIIRRSMTARLFSTIVTVVTVAIAVALMLVLLSMRDSGRRAFERGSGNMHLLVSRDDSALVSILNGVFYANAPRRPLTWSQYERIANDPRLEYAIPTQLGDSFRGYPVLATTPEFLTKFQPAEDTAWSFAQGEGFDEPFEVSLGATLADDLGLRIGDQLVLAHGMKTSADAGDVIHAPSGHEEERESGDPAAEENGDDHAGDDHEGEAHAGENAAHLHDEYRFTVVGVLEPTGSAHDRALMTDIRGSWIMHAHDRRARETAGAIELTTLADVLDSDRLITGIYVRAITREGGDVSAALPQVFSELRRDASLTIAQPKQEIDKLFTIVGSIDQIFLGMAMIVLVASAIGIMLALYNSMEQRRRQIAVLRVLGASRGRIFSLIVTESAMIGALGAAFGFGLWLVGLAYVIEQMNQRLGLVIEPALEPALAMVTLLGAVALAALAGVVPAAMAYRTPVARNLRPLG